MMELAANLLVAFLLALTTTWCVLLYRRLAQLRIERRDIEEFVAAIDAATQRAESATAGIRATAHEAQQALRDGDELVKQRAAELARLVEIGGRMARRIEAAVHEGARAGAGTAASPIGKGVERSLRTAKASAAPDDVGSTVAPPLSGPERRAGGPRLDADLLRTLEGLR
jgi:ABC-type transporter Mla subunit MlaD